EIDELLHPTRCQSVTAHLLAGETRLLQQQNVNTGAGEIGGHGGARRTRTDDDDLGVVSHAASLRVTLRLPCTMYGHHAECEVHPLDTVPAGVGDDLR